MRDRQWPSGAYLAEFESAKALTDAVRALERGGYTALETYSPIPVSLGLRPPRSRLPIVVFAAGLLGGVASYAIQWYANVYAYPLDIGGRPAHAVPAFIIPAFEGTVLCAALAAFIGFFVIARLPQPWHPVFEIDDFERTTVDRYWVAVDANDNHVTPQTPSDLFALAPMRVIKLEGEV